MLRKRACWITGIIVLAQVGMIVGYYTVLQGDAAPSTEDKPKKIAAAAGSTADKKGPTPPFLATGSGSDSPLPTAFAPVLPDAKASHSAVHSGPASERVSGPKKEKEIKNVAAELPADSLEAPVLAVSTKPNVPTVAKPESPGKLPRQAITPAAGLEVAPPAGVTGPLKTEEPILQTAATIPPAGSASVGSVPVPPLLPGTSLPSPEPLAKEGPVAGTSPTPLPAAVITVPVKGPATTAACPWALRVGLVKGKTQLIAQSGKAVQFRVTCDQLALQAPRGTIEAQGAVHLSSNGLEGDCDRMTISWQEDQVVLDGQAHLQCHRDGQDMELKAAHLSLRLTPVAKADVDKETNKKGTTKSQNDDREESSLEANPGVKVQDK